MAYANQPERVLFQLLKSGKNYLPSNNSICKLINKRHVHKELIKLAI